MRNLKWCPVLIAAALMLASSQVSVSGQSVESRNQIASLSAAREGVRWEVSVPHTAVTLTVSAPDGRVFRKEFSAGDPPAFSIFDKKNGKLPDGNYIYELRLTPVLLPELKKELEAARLKSDAALEEVQRRVRAQLPTYPLVQSGAFSILQGAVVVAGEVEPDSSQASDPRTEVRVAPPQDPAPAEALARPAAFFLPARAVEASGVRRLARPFAARTGSLAALRDQVIPDDLIVQGSICVGFDCVVNESFGTDTIRLKENNTRIKFDDTSTGAFPANDWQLTANDSTSGGANKFSIEDITGAKVPFTLTAGAPTNSVFVSSIGRLGLRTSTPSLDIHVNTSDTPAFRLEQNSSGGFTAQTWDIGANEANFFVRDLTGGSKLPFRIRPGAPTSSLDIAASGNVGLGTASPNQKLHVISGSATEGIAVGKNDDQNRLLLGYDNTNNVGVISSYAAGSGGILALNPTGDRVGIGTTTPDQMLTVNGGASKPAGGSWAVFSDERLKNIKGRFTSGLKAVMQLQPIIYEYKANNALGLKAEGRHVGFGAQTLRKVIPEAVTENASGYMLVNNDPILWAMLNAIKEQQKEIEDLKAQLRRLQPRARGARRRR